MITFARERFGLAPQKLTRGFELELELPQDASPSTPYYFFDHTAPLIITKVKGTHAPNYLRLSPTDHHLNSSNVKGILVTES